MKITIIVAMPEEFRAVAKCLTTGTVRLAGNLKARNGVFARHTIVLAEVGIGFNNAARAAETVIRETEPDMLISTGFCGGIAAELKVGDVVVAKKIVIASETGIEDVPVATPAQAFNFLSNQAACGARVFGGTFAGTPVITSKIKLAGMLHRGYPCPVVEMESAAIALVAAENKIPFIALRAVSDPVDEELGFSLDEFCDNSMHIRPGRVLMTILRKPRIIPQLFHLAGNCRIAASSLTVSIEQLLHLL